MGLLSRIEARQCAVVGCAHERAGGSDVCRADVTEKAARRLVQLADGTYLRRRAFVARDETGLAA